MWAIVGIQLNRIRKLLTDQKIGFELTAAAQMFMADTGYNPIYGARPLKRTIQNLLKNPFVEGDEIVVEVEEQVLVFNHKTSAKVEAV